MDHYGDIHMSITLGPIILDRRADGTISSARETITETFVAPSGRETTETFERPMSLADVDAALGSAYTQYDAHNAALEVQIAAEREAAAATIAALTAAHTTAISEKDARIEELEIQCAERDGQIAALEAELSGEGGDA